MRKMKDSGVKWIGEIPEEWKIEKLKYHTDFNPATQLPSFEDDDEVSFVPMENLKDGYHMVTTMPYSNVKKGYTIFALGDILMAKVTPCLENGNLAIADHLINGIGFGSTEINVIRCHDIKTKYLFYYLQMPKFIERATYDMFGVAGLKRLVPSFIPESYYPIPPSDEQIHIADYLDQKCDEINKVIKAKETTNEKLKEYRQSVIYEAVTKSLNKNAKMKDSGIKWIGKIPEGWEIEKLKYHADVIMGQSPTSEYYNTDGIGIPFLQGNADFSNKNPVERVYTEFASKYCKKYDILLSVRAPIGAINIADKKYAIGRGLCSINGYSLLNCYIWYLADIMRTAFEILSTGSTFESISVDDVRNVLLPIPQTRNEQQKIADYLDHKCAEIDSVIESNTKTIEKLKEYRQSVIYEAVTGKIEV